MLPACKPFGESEGYSRYSGSLPDVLRAGNIRSPRIEYDQFVAFNAWMRHCTNGRDRFVNIADCGQIGLCELDEDVHPDGGKHEYLDGETVKRAMQFIPSK